MKEFKGACAKASRNMLVYEGGYYNNTSIEQLERNDSKVCRNQRRASADQIGYE